MSNTTAYFPGQPVQLDAPLRRASHVGPL